MDKPLQALFFKDFKNAYIPDILEEIYIKKIYEPFLLGKKDLLIGDWGANIGLSVFYFKDYAKQIYAAEPAKQHLDTLNHMLTFNKITNVTVCPYAIAAKDGTERFYHNDNSTMFSLEKTVNKQDDFEEVETCSVETFFKRNSLTYLDILKWDTEGNESEILVSQSFKEYAPKIKVIFGEYHNWTAMNQVQFKNTFEELGFDFHWNNTTRAATYSAVRV